MRHPETRKTVAITEFFPRVYFMKRQIITLASLVSGKKSLAQRGNDHGFAANDPPFRVGRRQAVHREIVELARRQTCFHVRHICCVERKYDLSLPRLT
jgi:hypothetical protein